MAPPPEPDLLERVRAGDREALRALVAFWGRPSMRVALALTGEDRAAATAVRDAWLGLWRALPGAHSHAPFRPMLLRAVADAAVGRAPADPATDLQRCLASLNEHDRTIAVLAACGYGVPEIALAMKRPLPRMVPAARKASAALSACLGRDPAGVVPDANVPAGMVEQGLLPRVDDVVVLAASRVVACDVRDAWRALTAPAAVATWLGEQVRVRPAPIEPGMRATSVDRIANVKLTQEHVFTRVEELELLAWTSGATRRRGRPAIELRWSVTLERAGDGCAITHTLHGRALPPGVAGRRLRRVAGKIADALQGVAHRRLEQIAAAAEAVARGAAL